MNYSTLRFIRDLWGYIKPYKRIFIIATCNRIVSDVLYLYPPFAMASIVTFFAHYTPGTSLKPLYVIFILWFLTISISYVFVFVAKYKGLTLAKRVSVDTYLICIKHLFLLDISWHEKENAGNKLKRITKGGDSLERVIRFWFGNYIEIIVNFVVVTCIIFYFDTMIGVFVILFIITFYIGATFYKKKIMLVNDKLNGQEEHLNGLLFESINNVRSIKVMSMSRKLETIIAEAVKRVFETARQAIYLFHSVQAARSYYSWIFRIGVSIYIIYGITKGFYDVGFLILFIGYFNAISQSVKEFSDVTQDAIVAKYAVARMQKLRAEPITIDDELGKKKFSPDWKVIKVMNLSFSYGGKNVLEDVSFEIKRGEKIGVVGLSGAGKSTLFKLLLKEHENYAGAIYFDDVPLKQISKKDYFNYLAVVLQDTELFNMSLKDNITITNSAKEKDTALLDTSISTAHVRDFMNKLPQGMDSIVGEKGVKLSGGEKQRVGIARAVFKNPQILLLDEATSHLDVESEEKIQDSLHQFFQSVTAVVIAHRLSTIKEMDRIIVLEHGKIIESGSFTQLRRLKGRFYELWEKQKL